MLALPVVAPIVRVVTPVTLVRDPRNFGRRPAGWGGDAAWQHGYLQNLALRTCRETPWASRNAAGRLTCCRCLRFIFILPDS